MTGYLAFLLWLLAIPLAVAQTEPEPTPKVLYYGWDTPTPEAALG